MTWTPAVYTKIDLEYFNQARFPKNIGRGFILKIFRFFADFDKSRFLNFFSRFIQYSCPEFIINFKFIG